MAIVTEVATAPAPPAAAPTEDKKTLSKVDAGSLRLYTFYIGNVEYALEVTKTVAKDVWAYGPDWVEVKGRYLPFDTTRFLNIRGANQTYAQVNTLYNQCGTMFVTMPSIGRPTAKKQDVESLWDAIQYVAQTQNYTTILYTGVTRSVEPPDVEPTYKYRNRRTSNEVRIFVLPVNKPKEK